MYLDKIITEFLNEGQQQQQVDIILRKYRQFNIQLGSTTNCTICLVDYSLPNLYIKFVAID